MGRGQRQAPAQGPRINPIKALQARGTTDVTQLLELRSVLPSLQFSDFHKFLVSAGGFSIVASAAFPLLLRTQKVNTMTAKQVSELPPTSRDALELQQTQALWLLRSWPYISGALALLGMTLVVVGAVMWKRRQDVLNSKELIEIEKIKADREKTYQETLVLIRGYEETVDEIVEAIGEKVEDVGPSIPRRDDQSPVTPPPEVQDEANATTDMTKSKRTRQSFLREAAETAPSTRGVLRFMLVRQMLTEAVGQLYGPNADIVTDVRVGPSRADIVVTSRSPNATNLVVNVLTLPEPHGRAQEILNRAVDWIVAVGPATVRKFGEKFRPVVVFIIPESKLEVEEGLLKLGLQIPAYFNYKTEEATILNVQERQLDSLHLEMSWFTAPGINSRLATTPTKSASE